MAEVVVSDDKKGSAKKRKKAAVEEENRDQICEQCKSGLHGEVMLLCDRCDKGWHLHCLTPPLESVPPGNWYCLECVNSDKDSFGFVPGKKFSLASFRRRNDRARRKWLGQTNVSRAQIEKKFWDIVEGRGGEVEVIYGSDLDTFVHGSGFPRVGDPVPDLVDEKVWREYCSSPWNLNNLPKLPGSMLRAVHDNIAGVMVPWLYIGMLFSSFCWHVEDHCFYSINYLHWGEPKCWYGVPGTEAIAFEKVMRNTLPDLFEAQPDLLFQLVTMLNPSVLQENDVPVYSVLQEPGNFVITFPKSFHGGFNLGLNCAEAVNFAPADWLPHGGFGAEWYRLYHKAAVFSHEELLCVVSKNDCDTKALPYLREEMHRIFIREKRCREELWKNGTIRSSKMSPRRQPTYVGTEEDPTCIICQQYLYLSAITCSCRPSIFVCLEHRKHLCECNSSKHCLLYRHTLAELGDLVYMDPLLLDATCRVKNQQSRSQRHLNNSSDMAKKVNGCHISYSQLAEDWLSNSCHLFEIPFSNTAYASALEEAEQFLWADHDMDMVRDMTCKLMEAQKWAVALRSSLRKVDNCLQKRDSHIEKLSLREIEELVTVNPLPCHEPGHAKLKVYAEKARALIGEIESSLTSCFDICKLELLYSRVIEFPVNLVETGRLERTINSAKIWINDADKCLSAKKFGVIDIDFLNKIKSKMAELHVQVPQMDWILNLCGEIDSWQVRCRELLNGPINLKELEDFLQDAKNVKIGFPEMQLLRKYQFDAFSWIASLNDIMPNLKEREDHENIVVELKCILKAGKSLRVQVDELHLVEAELERCICREKAKKALEFQMALEFLQQLLEEASLLKIKDEKLFLEISRVVTAAIAWEERAKYALEHAGHLSEFEDVVRTSETIFAVLPSLPDVKEAILSAQSWISKSEPYLMSAIHDGDTLVPLLNVDDLKALVIQSKHLKVTLDGVERLQCILNDIYEWENNARSLLEHLKPFLYMHDADVRIDSLLQRKTEELLSKIDSAIKVGVTLGFELNELTKLQAASLTLSWILKALSFCLRIPSCKEVVSLLEDAHRLSVTFQGKNLGKVLVKGASWLRKALITFPGFQSSKRCKLKDVEEILEESQRFVVPYPMMVAHLRNAIGKHESWIKEVYAFFNQHSVQSWASLRKLKEHGQSYAFDCPELDKVVYEVEKVDKWMIHCRSIVVPLVGDRGSLFTELVQVRSTLDRALCIYRGSRGYRSGSFCVCCPNDSKDDVYTCLTCDDRYHFSCMGPPLDAAGTVNEYACPFCLCMESGTITRQEGHALICRGNRPEVQTFLELLSVAEDFYLGIKEIALTQEIVEQALQCKKYLTEIVDQALSHHDKDLSTVSESLQRALKGLAVAGVYDVEDGSKLESAVSKYSWKIRVKKLLKGSKKPSIQHILRLLKEGLAIGIQPEDHFMQEITEVKQISLRWADVARKVASDSGELELSEVFKLINDGEVLPVHFEKEMKLLRDRSVLYCICRKPYDQRAMIACDQCDEWYHFECINLHKPTPKTFFCPACKPLNGEFISFPHPILHKERSTTDEEPRTPPACHSESKRRMPKKARCSLQQKMETAADLSDILRYCSEVSNLWRENKKPLQRTVKRRSEFEWLSQFSLFHD